MYPHGRLYMQYPLTWVTLGTTLLRASMQQEYRAEVLV
jgi:hypothetical protein